MNVKPKKWLGQHFLRTESFSQRIAALIPLPKGPTVLLEVGPGTAALTKHLPTAGFSKVLLVEIDRESIAFLQADYAAPPYEIVPLDFLKLNLEELTTETIYVAGNFPYNISTQILFKVLEHRDQVPFCIGMLQKEVGRRISNGPGTKEYGILSVLLQLWYDVKYEFLVPPGAFVPPPKVDSCVVSCTRNERMAINIPEKYFTSLVKEAFNQRRKTLRNAVKSFTPAGTDHPMLDKRAEQLGIEDFLLLAEFLYKANTKPIVLQ